METVPRGMLIGFDAGNAHTPTVAYVSLGTLCGTAGADTSAQRDLEPRYNTPVPRIASTAWARRVSSRNISAPYKTHLGQGMF